MHLFRRSWTGPDGRERHAKRWSVEFADHRGARRRLALYPDHGASVSWARTLGQLVEARRAGEPVPASVLTWVRRMSPEHVAQLVRWRLIDERRAQAVRPIADLLEDWRTSLRLRGVTAQHEAGSVRLVVRVLIEGCGCYRLADIDELVVAGWLDERTGPEGWSARSYNAALQALKAFGRWCVAGGLLPAPPFPTLQARNVARDPRRPRRALSEEVLRRLIAATWRSTEVRHGLDGPRRALVYWLAAETGLRASELSRLRVGDLQHYPTGWHVVLPAAAAKTVREAVVWLRPTLGEAVAEVAARRHPAALLLELPVGAAARIMRPDLEAIGEPWVDARGEVADFHALRHTFVTHAANAAGTHRTAQELARHATPGLTAHYTHPTGDDMRSTLSRMPDLTPAPLRNPQRAAVGDEGRAGGEAPAPTDVLGVASGTQAAVGWAANCPTGPPGLDSKSVGSGFESLLPCQPNPTQGAEIGAGDPPPPTPDQGDEGRTEGRTPAPEGCDPADIVGAAQLREIVQAWASLTWDQRLRVLSIVRGVRRG